jgi:lauroyl/myristoyl acyltransferase
MWRLFHFSVYLAFRGCLFLIQLVPIELVFVVGLCGGEVAYWLLWKRRRLSLLNLSRAFKDQKSPGELRALNRLHFRRLAANLLCCFKIDTMPRDEILKRVTVEKPASLRCLPKPSAPGGWP